MDFEELRDRVVKYLIEQGISISCMESCTSGLLASMITDTSGASAIFFGSLVTYANATKIAAGVDAKVIENYGVYSEETAKAMARVAQKKYATELAIGVTGTTGNVDPNNPDSVSGEVHYAIVFKNKVQAYTFKTDVTKLNRKEIKQLYAEKVFESLAEMFKIV